MDVSVCTLSDGLQCSGSVKEIHNDFWAAMKELSAIGDLTQRREGAKMRRCGRTTADFLIP
jgi:hypothetical protein